MNYSTDIGKISGVVGVTAYADPQDPAKLVKWELYSLPETGHTARIYKHPETGDDSINYFFGEYPMPFLLTLERTK